MATTDTVLFTCTACGHTAAFPKAQEGKAIYCPQCQAAQVVKGAPEVERIATGRIAKAEASPGTDRITPQPFGTPNRIDFVCGACNHTSRISSTLSGQPVRCPTCGTVQLAGVTGLRVVRLDGSGKLPFTCSTCGYQARLNADYGGKAIRCPKCQGAQVVPRVLRDPSGAQPALPSGAVVVRKEPGTGAVRRDGTGPIRKDPGSATTRTEPLAALRTPAGGVPVAQPAATPTPTPPPRANRTPLPQAAPEPSASGPLSPLAPSDPEPKPAAPPPARAAAPPPIATPVTSPMRVVTPPPSAGDDLFAEQAGDGQIRPKGGVVRRSGRMRTPMPGATDEPLPVPPDVQPGLGAEPTLEPARAVDPEPDEAAPATAPARAGAYPVRPASPAAFRPWLVPVFGVLCVVLALVAVVLGVMMASANDSVSKISGQLASEQKRSGQFAAEVETAKRDADEKAAAHKLVADDRDRLKAECDAARHELESLRAEVERLKAEAAAHAAMPAPAPVPSAVGNAPKPGGK